MTEVIVIASAATLGTVSFGLCSYLFIIIKRNKKKKE